MVLGRDLNLELKALESTPATPVEQQAFVMPEFILAKMWRSTKAAMQTSDLACATNSSETSETLRSATVAAEQVAEAKARAQQLVAQATQDVGVVSGEADSPVMSAAIRDLANSGNVFSSIHLKAFANLIITANVICIGIGALLFLVILEWAKGFIQTEVWLRLMGLYSRI
jgi:hypothetical protein